MSSKIIKYKTLKLSVSIFSKHYFTTYALATPNASIRPNNSFISVPTQQGIVYT